MKIKKGENDLENKYSFQEIQNLMNQRNLMPCKLPTLKAMQRGFDHLIQNNPSISSNLTKSKVILIAGTNGKGTVAKTLQTLLTENNQYVGLFTSPHLMSICESIQIDGQPLSEDLFVKCFHLLFDIYQKWHLSHFEMLTLMTTELFFGHRISPSVKYAIFEVGMGGKLDATNVIPHDLSIITQISYDHQHLLGYNLEDIAKHKLGIISKNNQVVAASCFWQNPRLASLKKNIQKQTQSQWHTVDSFSYQTQYSPPEGFISIYGQKQKMGLLGRRSAENTAMALKAYQLLGFNPQAHLKTLAKVQWKGRMHQENITFCPCSVYFSGDHNKQGIESLIEILKDFHYKNIYFLVSVGQAKDPEDILSDLFNVKNAFIYLTTAHFRGMQKSEYRQWLSKVSGYIAKPQEAFLQICKKCQKDDLFVVTGSLYLVGELMSYLKSKESIPSGCESK